eukprot:6176480-Pleurochrysis_carterae.AAC.1
MDRVEVRVYECASAACCRVRVVACRSARLSVSICRRVLARLFCLSSFTGADVFFRKKSSPLGCALSRREAQLRAHTQRCFAVTQLLLTPMVGRVSSSGASGSAVAPRVQTPCRRYLLCLRLVWVSARAFRSGQPHSASRETAGRPGPAPHRSSR